LFLSAAYTFSYVLSYLLTVQVRGLCGNMDGSMSNDWTSRSGIEEKLLSSFAMSYSVCGAVFQQYSAAVGHDVGHVVDTCSAADSAVTSP